MFALRRLKSQLPEDASHRESRLKGLLGLSMVAIGRLKIHKILSRLASSP